MLPTIGRVVHYTLTDGDATEINRRRQDFASANTLPEGTSGQPATGFQAHVGNHAEAGQVFPATVVRVFHPTVTTANLQVALDGNDTYWATSRTEGEGPGHWSWPPRV